jgi:transposase
VVAVTPGQRHESTQAISLLERTTERMWPAAVTGDRGYSTADVRNWLAAREIAAVIPKRSNELGPHAYDTALYRERPVIEQTINRLKRWRRVATRYETLDTTYLAMVTIAMILEWL